MKLHRFKIKVMNIDDAGKDFVKAWKEVSRRQTRADQYDLILGVPDITWLGRILSPERIRMIQTIRDHRPQSLRQLAKLLNRAQQNVQKEAQELAELGILELKSVKKKGQKRASIQPLYNWDGFDIAV